MADRQQETAARFFVEYRAEADRQYRAFSKDYGANAIRALFLLNGGAAIAILTLIGSLFSKGDPNAFKVAWVLAHKMPASLTFFGTGLALTVVASGCGYLNFMLLAMAEPNGRELHQWMMGVTYNTTARNWTKTINTLVVIAIIACLASLTCFARGGMIAVHAFHMAGAALPTP